jgi:serine/threonine protein kinase
MMRSPLAFFRFIAKAGLNAVGGGVAGDFAVEFLPEMAKDVWQWWGKDGAEAQLLAEVQNVAQLPPDVARQQAEQAASETAAGQPDTVRQALAAYLTQVPNAIRQSQRRSADPTGRTVASGLTLRGPDDLLHLLPARLPRFKPGDRPAGIGDWELEELLGVGGFGEVWKAKNPHLAEPVALKFCLDSQAARVLRNEAALLGRVMSQGVHPGIVKLRHTYLSAEPPCLEYDYVAGGDLTEAIRRLRLLEAPARVAKANRLMHALSKIIALAHRAEPPIVHRDLKPANILLQPRGGNSELWVADFGIGGLAAKQELATSKQGVSRGALLASALRGSHTPLYASPQQVRGDPPDPRDDVHALGVIWFQLLTGELQQAPGIDYADDLQALGVSASVVRLLGQCVASKLERRLHDAGALAEQFQILLRGESQSTVQPQAPAGVAEKRQGPNPAAGPPPPPGDPRVPDWLDDVSAERPPAPDPFRPISFGKVDDPPVVEIVEEVPDEVPGRTRRQIPKVEPEGKYSHESEERRRRRDDHDEPRDRGMRCPHCHYGGRPLIRSRVAAGGWIFLGVFAFMCLFLALFTCGISVLFTPLCLLGLLIRSHYQACGECGMRLR